MKTLPESFQKHGFLFTLIERHGQFATYRKVEENWRHSENFETVIIQSHNGRVIAGQAVGPAKYMPSSESWGSLGWSFQDRESALKKLSQLTTRMPRLVPTKRDRSDFVEAGV